MSTKRSLKWSEPATGRESGFHLYDEVFDEFSDSGEEPPVYLHLRGVEAELRTQAGGGAELTVVLPRPLARQLGLLPQDGQDGSPAGDSK